MTHSLPGHSPRVDDPRPGRSPLRSATLWKAAALGLLLGLAACATNRYVGPTSGRSADAQSAMARALDRVLSRFPWEQLSGREIAVSAVTLTEGFGSRSAEERYLEEAVRERARAAGALLAPPGTAAVEVRVLGRALGVTRTRRDLILLYYSELVEGVADVEISLYEPKEARQELFGRRETAKVYRRKTYLFYMIGPMVKEWEE